MELCYPYPAPVLETMLNLPKEVGLMALRIRMLMLTLMRVRNLLKGLLRWSLELEVLVGSFP